MGENLPVPIESKPWLPKPQFSFDNPYWPAGRLVCIKPEFRPRLTARDFLYASVWEINKPFDIHAAACVRKAVIDTAALNLKYLGLILREQFRTKEQQK